METEPRWKELLSTAAILFLMGVLLYLFFWGLSRERCWSLPRNTTVAEAQEWERTGVSVSTDDDGNVEACE